MINVIGICGLIGSGKDTISNILVNKFDYKKVAFADSLKDCVSIVFGWDRYLLEGDTIESREFRNKIDLFWTKKFGYEITPRHILQKMGTETMRTSLIDSIWINSLEKKLVSGYKYVISDVRFPNEIDFIHQMNGKIIEVKRGRYPHWWNDALQDKALMISNHSDIHVSEWSWIGHKIDYNISNDSTLEKLESDIKYALTFLNRSAIVA